MTHTEGQMGLAGMEVSSFKPISKGLGSMNKGQVEQQEFIVEEAQEERLVDVTHKLWGWIIDGK